MHLSPTGKQRAGVTHFIYLFALSFPRAKRPLFILLDAISWEKFPKFSPIDLDKKTPQMILIS